MKKHFALWGSAIAFTLISVFSSHSGIQTGPPTTTGSGGSSGTNGSFYNLTVTNQLSVGVIHPWTITSTDLSGPLGFFNVDQSANVRALTYSLLNGWTIQADAGALNDYKLYNTNNIGFTEYYHHTNGNVEFPGGNVSRANGSFSWAIGGAGSRLNADGSITTPNASIGADGKVTGTTFNNANGLGGGNMLYANSSLSGDFVITSILTTIAEAFFTGLTPNGGAVTNLQSTNIVGTIPTNLLNEAVGEITLASGATSTNFIFTHSFPAGFTNYAVSFCPEASPVVTGVPSIWFVNNRLSNGCTLNISLGITGASKWLYICKPYN